MRLRAPQAGHGGAALEATGGWSKSSPTNSSKQNDTCVCNAGFAPSTDSSACVAASSSVNLSSGVIAGILVTVIVMMSGLVDFLCQGSVTLIVNVSTLASPAPVPL